MTGTFDELLTLDEPRTDCPMHFPEAPPVAAPWTCPGCQNTASDLRRLEAASEDASEGQHCSAQKRVCEGSAAVTERQRRMVRHLMGSPATDGVAPLDLERSTFAEAEEWIERQSAKRMRLPAPPKLTADQFLHWTRSGR